MYNLSLKWVEKLKVEKQTQPKNAISQLYAVSFINNKVLESNLGSLGNLVSIQICAQCKTIEIRQVRAWSHTGEKKFPGPICLIVPACMCILLHNFQS